MHWRNVGDISTFCEVKGLHWAASASGMLPYLRVNLELGQFTYLH
jgi:hypothetical protein